jgi:hypothetical protein
MDTLFKLNKNNAFKLARILLQNKDSWQVSAVWESVVADAVTMSAWIFRKDLVTVTYSFRRRNVDISSTKALLQFYFWSGCYEFGYTTTAIVHQYNKLRF